jgi:hypothetical protein
VVLSVRRRVRGQTGTWLGNAHTADAASPEQGHVSLRLSRQAIASSSTRIASATGTTGRAWNSKAGSIEQNL